MARPGDNFAIQVQTLFDGESFMQNCGVLIEDGRIIDVLPSAELPENFDIQLMTEGILAPGFVDLQVNGGGGVMLNEVPTQTTVNTMAAAHRTRGTTAMTPTVISDTREVQQAAIEAVVKARAAGHPGILGVHIEGPFFDRDKRGAHRAGFIRRPMAEDIEWLCSLNGLPVIITLAPEHALPGQIRQLTQAGLHVCAGHTNASYEQINTAITEGLQGFTHLFNAMSPLSSRAPGTVGAALDNEDTWVGVIADGHHIHPASIRIAHRAKAADKLFLVTDAMATVGSDDTAFEIHGTRIEAQEGRLVNAQGVLAGSAIGMIDAVRIANTEVGLPLAECLRMASLIPATFLSLDNELGRIASGYRADLVHFDNDFNVHNTWVCGAHRAHRHNQESPPG
ncbi:MAG: N-acetylglucosamine-6-phosphate deacetylase [Halieaceae bacterium]|jgi:N-acetylglucosamine-6-phosphate deacetylase|nr:N-acetylglucosamine-6-phosphate deacetylase [Halieaceae bacterium]